MRERGHSFKRALNEALRAGLVGAPGEAASFRTPTFPMGHSPEVPLDTALRLAADLEDDELVRRLATRK